MKKMYSGLRLKRSLSTSFIVMRIVLFIMCFLFVSVSINTYSQNQPSKTVSGNIVDGTNTPMLGVSIQVKGTTIGTISDINGNFSLSVPGDAKTLVFSFVGMATQEVAIGNQTQFSITLLESAIGLGEVIVVGYGSQKKESIVGAIVQTTSEQLEKTGGVSNLAQALTGQLPGVTTIQYDGEPGADDPRILIRAQGTWNNSQPLILVDGVERKMNDIDISEVVTISVLKDASATAVFGVKGSEGVILITTKRGRIGKPQMSVDFEANAKTVSMMPQRMDSYEGYMFRNQVLEHELAVNTSQWANYQPMQMAEYYKKPQKGTTQGIPNYLIFPNVDWTKEILKPVAWSNHANFNISGGSNFARYFGSLSYLHEGDLMNTGLDNGKPYDAAWGYDRFNYRTNLDFDITQTTTFSVNLSGYVGIKTDSYNVSAQGSGNQTIFSELYQCPPNIFPLRFPTGEWGSNPNVNTGNTVATINNLGVEKKTRTQVSSDFSLKQKLDFITEGLSVQGTLSYDTRFNSAGGILDLGNSYSKWIDPEIINMLPGQTVADYTYGTSRSSGAEDFAWVQSPVSYRYDNFTSFSGDGRDYWNVGYDPNFRQMFYQVQMNYARVFGKHDIGVTGVMNRNQYAEGSMFPSYREDWVGRITYNYNSKYLFETNGAYNGSEKFDQKYRFGFFPSVAFGWVASNEDFLKFDWLDKLKFRYSIGKVGNDNFNAPRWAYSTNWASDDLTAYGLGYFNSPYTQWKQAVIGNPDLHWEASTKSNFGLELGLLNNKINFNLDYFTDHRTDIFLSAGSRRIPQFFGANAVAANIGETKTKGYELELKLQNTTATQLYYWGSWAFTHAIDEVIFIEDPVLLPEYQKSQGYQIGQYRTQFSDGYMNNWDDIFASTPWQTSQNSKLPGDYDMVDFNGDGILDANDSAPYSFPSSRPQNTYNFSLGADFRGFSLMVQFYGVYNVSRTYSWIMRPLSDRFNSIVLTEFRDTWTPENTDAKYKAIRYGSHSDSLPVGTQWWVDGSYLRLKTAEIAYTFSKGLIKKVGLNSLKLYANGNNLLLWSKMIDDRETNNDLNEGYPMFRRVNLGINFTF